LTVGKTSEASNIRCTTSSNPQILSQFANLLDSFMFLCLLTKRILLFRATNVDFMGIMDLYLAINVRNGLFRSNFRFESPLLARHHNKPRRTERSESTATYDAAKIPV